jgi:hypothetical protein
MILTGCDEARSQRPSASATMKLPPPRPADARPGFSELIGEVPEAAEASAS